MISIFQLLGFRVPPSAAPKTDGLLDGDLFDGIVVHLDVAEIDAPLSDSQGIRIVSCPAFAEHASFIHLSISVWRAVRCRGTALRRGPPPRCRR
jgi:hypothetical protein